MDAENEPTQESTNRQAELERLARGWAHFLRTVERIRREEEGKPLVEVMDDAA